MTIITEQDLLTSIQAAQAIEATHEILDALTQLAGIYIERGETQEGADVLAFVMRCDDMPDDVYDLADEHWEDLARYICPRVLLDAEDFGSKATLADVIAYVFAGT